MDVEAQARLRYWQDNLFHALQARPRSLNIGNDVGGVGEVLQGLFRLTDAHIPGTEGVPCQ